MATGVARLLTNDAARFVEDRRNGFKVIELKNFGGVTASRASCAFLDSSRGALIMIIYWLIKSGLAKVTVSICVLILSTSTLPAINLCARHKLNRP